MPKKLKKRSAKATPDVVPHTLLAFAEPLIRVYDDDKLPRTRAGLERILLIARSLWNAPGEDAVATLVAAMPAAMADAARVMARDRKERFADVHWRFGDVAVVDDGAGGLAVKAEALIERAHAGVGA